MVSDSHQRVLSIAQNNSHVPVLLLYGERGCGLEPLAEKIAKTWIAGDKDPEAIDLERSVDFLRVEPQGASSWIHTQAIRPTKSRRANVDSDFGEGERPSNQGETLSVLEFLRTRPLIAPCKVVLVSRPDRLQPRAANSFLKLLEEIQPYGRIVLATYDIGRVLSTIRSRALCISVATGRTSVEIPDHLAIFGKTPGDYEFIAQHDDIYGKLSDLLNQFEAQSPLFALRAAEICRNLGETLAKDTGESIRDGHVRILEAIGNWLSVRNPIDWESAHQVSKSAGLIMSNANAASVYDLLLGSILTRNSRN